MPIFVVLILAAVIVWLVYKLVLLILGVICYIAGLVFGFGAGVLSWWVMNVPLAIVGIVAAGVIAQVVVRVALNAAAKGRLNSKAIQPIAIVTSIIIASLAVVSTEHLLVAHGHISPIFQSIRSRAETSSKFYTPPKPVWKKSTLKKWANNGQARGGSIGLKLGLISGFVLMAITTIGGAGMIGAKTHESLAASRTALPPGVTTAPCQASSTSHGDQSANSTVDPQLVHVTSELGITWPATTFTQSDLAELEAGLQRWERAKTLMMEVKGEMALCSMSDAIDDLQILAQQIYGLNQAFLTNREWQSHAQAYAAAFDEIEQRSPIKTALDVLGLSRALLDVVSLKKAYRAAAMQHHPDRGGDAGLFVEAGKAKGRLEDYLKHKGGQPCQRAA